MAEYAVVMTVITISVVAMLALLSTKIQSLITSITPLV
jgi:Flp pilus assembly pilin Flp